MPEDIKITLYFKYYTYLKGFNNGWSRLSVGGSGWNEPCQSLRDAFNPGRANPLSPFP